MQRRMMAALAGAAVAWSLAACSGGPRETSPVPLPGGPGMQEFGATGNEPGWRLLITEEALRLDTDYGERRIVRPLPEPERGEGFIRYTSRQAGAVSVTIEDRRCTDDMSGMPHPKTVVVVMDGRTLRGCGGRPAALLEGVEWVVEDLDRGGIIDRSRVMLEFAPDGRLSGRASCNQYTGRWKLTGEGLTISGVSATRRSCAPSLMNQERKFLELLGRTSGFSMDRNGKLVLRAGDRAVIRATRG